MSEPSFDPARYTSGTMRYRRAGRSGVDLSMLSLGLWQNFGGTTPFETQRSILRRAIELGITHIDLANNYGPPYGAAELGFGEHLRRDLRPVRDELFISSKAGYDMWAGPYGDGGSRKYLIASIDQSLRRTGLDYFDVFYHHRPDPSTPLEETMGALADIVRSGKALYAAVSNYDAATTSEAARVMGEAGGRMLLHQPRYSMFDRHVEDGSGGSSILEAADTAGLGVVVFSPLAQGLLTDRYLDGIPDGSRATVSKHLRIDDVTEERVAAARALHGIAQQRGQTLAQFALAWVLRDERVTSAIIGASSVHQLEDNVRALAADPVSADEAAAVDAVLRQHIG